MNPLCEYIANKLNNNVGKIHNKFYEKNGYEEYFCNHLNFGCEIAKGNKRY